MNLVVARFTFRQMIRGAIIFGICVSLLTCVQGISLQKVYPNQKERDEIVNTLGTNPTIGFFYGENDHASTPAGYMFYRDGPISVWIAAVWGLLFATRMFRAQEEDGRSELLLTGTTTQAKMSAGLLLGILGGLVLAFLIVTAITSAVGTLDYINLSVGDSAYFALALVSNAAVFAAVGAFTSQLADTRRRAILLGVVPLFVFIVMRSVGNILSDYYWLKNYTPMGWVDQMHPVFDHNPFWLIPLGVSTVFLAGISIWLASRRDLGASVLPSKTTAKSHFRMLANTFTFSIRQTRGVLFAWGLLTLAMSLVTVGITKSAVEAFTASSAAKSFIQNFAGGGPSLEETFISAGAMFSVLILMAITIWGVGSMRGEEGKGLLDNLLVRKTSRIRWLMGRIVWLLIATTIIYTITSIAVWYVANLQEIEVSFTDIVLNGFNILAPVVAMLGLGVALFGLTPRIASWILYALLAWSFLEQVVASLIKDDTAKDYINSTSLLKLISLTPAETVNWTIFWQTIVCGLVLIAVGVYAFSRRDLISE